MATKERYQNPVIGDTLNLKLFTYNSNNRTNFKEIVKVIIYYLDENEITEENPNGKRLVEEIDGSNVNLVETGLYELSINLEDTKYIIGNYIDEWVVYVEDNDTATANIENNFEIYSDLWFTSPTPIFYDFSFSFRPNKIRKGSKQHLVVDIIPNVPNESDMNKYYANLAIMSPLKISIEMACGECIPDEQDLRLIIDKEDVTLNDKNSGFYFLNTEELNEGIYNVWFTMDFGENTFISPNQQIQIYS